MHDDPAVTLPRELRGGQRTAPGLRRAQREATRAHHERAPTLRADAERIQRRSESTVDAARREAAAGMPTR